MSLAKEIGKTGKAGRTDLNPFYFAVFCVFLAGCAGSHIKGDPLFGEHNKDGSAGSVAPAKTSATVPPIPLGSTASNAALAMATPLSGARPLSIGEPAPTPVAAAGKAPTALTSGPAVEIGKLPGGAALSRPQPVVVPLPRDTSDSVQPAGSWGTGVPPDQASAFYLSQLRARGVTWHRADSVAGGIHFACLIPNPQNPTITRVFEATAQDLPAAVQAVVQQIDQSK